MSYRLTPRAERGLSRIILYSEEHLGGTVADRVLDELVSAFELLAEYPGAGHRREDLTDLDDVLFWSVGPSLIAYRQRGDLIEILMIERGELDWHGKFSDG